MDRLGETSLKGSRRYDMTRRREWSIDLLVVNQVAFSNLTSYILQIKIHSFILSLIQSSPIFASDVKKKNT